ncbi:MAG: hypothetical protein IT245_05490 [Bacteroidia bacterium]|nr:hypothetical protein [Bacteroidia bacterium]
MSQNEVQCIYQDRDGILWIGTQDGLNSFKGYEYNKFGRTPFAIESLSSDVVNAIGEVGNELLVIGTNKGLDLLYLKQTWHLKI